MIGEEHDYNVTRAIGERAFDYLKEFGRCPSPENYALLYTHTAGYDKALSSALQSTVSAQAGLTPEDAETLYTKFLSPASRVAPVQAALASEAGNVARLIDTAAESTDDMCFSLELAKTQLGESKSVDDTDTAINALVKVSQEVARQNYVLEQRLAQSKEQLEELRGLLTVIRARQDGDGLTGLLTRIQFHQRLQRELAKAEKCRRCLCLAVFDIDEFHKSNERHGHSVGDQILRHVAGVIANRMRRGDSAARYAGDTFGVLMPDMPLDGGLRVAEQICETINAQRFIRKASGRSLGRVTVSAGVAAYRRGDSAVTLLERAAGAVRSAKRAGGNRIHGEAASGDAAAGAA